MEIRSGRLHASDFGQEDMDALRKSLAEKWDAGLSLKGIISKSCALCGLAFDREWSNPLTPTCSTCIIHKDTDSTRCCNTPYLLFEDAYGQDDELCAEYRDEELAYLEDLLERMEGMLE